MRSGLWTVMEEPHLSLDKWAWTEIVGQSGLHPCNVHKEHIASMAVKYELEIL